MRDDDLPSLDTLERKINQTKKIAPDVPEDVTNQGAGIAIRLSSELVSGILVGLIIGYFLDKWLGTSPVFLLVCLGLGTVAGFKTMFRTVKSLDRPEDKGSQE